MMGQGAVIKTTALSSENKKAMSKRLEVLKKSLINKEKELHQKFDNHFATVKQANGQPLNDKRNGQATLNKWEKQCDGIRSTKQSIEKTKRAIEKEEIKIKNLEAANGYLPEVIKQLIQAGALTQWNKHPNTFFVPGVNKARIIWVKAVKLVAHKYYNQIETEEQRILFAKTFNALSELFNR